MDQVERNRRAIFVYDFSKTIATIATIARQNVVSIFQ